MPTGFSSPGFKPLQGTNPFDEAAKNQEGDIGSSSNVFESLLGGLGDVAAFIGRPASAVSGFAQGLAKGDFGKAFDYAGKGLAGEKIYGFKDVLKTLGMSKGGSVDLPLLGQITGRGTLGFLLDIATDPLNLVGLVGFSKGARVIGGATKRKFLPKETLIKINELKNDFHTGYEVQKEAAVAQKLKEIERMRSPKAGNGTFGVAPQGGNPATFVSKNIKKGQQEGIQIGFMDDNYILEDLRQTAANKIRKEFDEKVLPGYKERFLEKNAAELGEDFGFDPKMVDSAKLLDDITNLNMNQAQMLRNAHANSMGVLGGFLTDQAAKGYRSLITLGLPGKRMSIEELAQAVGLPNFTLKKLRAIDTFVFKGIEQVTDRINKFPVVKAIRDALHMGTGFPELDHFLSLTKQVGDGSLHSAAVTATKFALEQDELVQKLDPIQKRTFIRQVIEFVESDNPHNTLNAASDPSNYWMPGVVNAGLKARELLDKSQLAEKSGRKLLGDNVRYLRGYFPRELSPEAKAILGDRMEESNILQKLLPRTTIKRTEAFNKLTTTEINDLFATNRLGFEGFATAMNDPKTLKKLGVVDPDLVEYFVSDPAKVIGNHIIRSTRKVTDIHKTADLLRIFGTPVFNVSAKLNPGEAMFSPLNLFKDPNFVKQTQRQQIAIMKEIFGEELKKGQASRIIKAAQKMSSHEMLRGAISGVGANPVRELLTELPLTSPHMLALMYDLKMPVFKAPKEVVRIINDMWTIKRNPETFKVIRKGFDEFTNAYKRLTLGIFPSYHFRNQLADFWQNNLAGINPLKESVGENGAYVASVSTLKEAGIFGTFKTNLQSALEPGKVTGHIIKNDGGKVSREFILSSFFRQGGLGGILKDVQILDTTPMDQIIDSLRKLTDKPLARINPLSKDFAPSVVGTKVGEIVSVQNRLAHYIAKIKEGYAPDEAMMSVRKYLFDYDDLSNFERNTLRRWFPFYTWTRKNIPLQLEMLVKQPGKFANLNKAIHALEDEELRKEIPEEGMPDYIKSEWGIVTKRTAPGVYEFELLGNFIPASDLIKVGSPSNVARLVLKSLHPGVQALAEPFIGKGGTNFFSNLPIERYPGEKGKFVGLTLDKTTINTLRKVRVFNSADKMFFGEDPNNPYQKKGFTFAEKGLSTLTGLNPRRIDVKKVAEDNQRAAGFIASKLKAGYEKALKNNDTQMIEYFKELLEENNATSPSK